MALHGAPGIHKSYPQPRLRIRQYQFFPAGREKRADRGSPQAFEFKSLCWETVVICRDRCETVRACNLKLRLCR
jgi:hypothetical protein